MDLNDEMHVALADIVQHHQLIIKVCHMLEDIASTFILVKSIQISFQICMLALTFIKVSNLYKNLNENSRVNINFRPSDRYCTM